MAQWSMEVFEVQSTWREGRRPAIEADMVEHAKDDARRFRQMRRIRHKVRRTTPGD